MRILLLDNYDSFTWNLHHVLEPLGAVTVKRNDGISVDEAASFDRIVLSPGPGLPSEAGILPELVRRLMPTHPILGICLGMQAIAEACGGSLYNQARVKHGVAVPCMPEHPTDPFFTGIEVPFEVGLYHSWAVDEGSLPKELRVTARSAEGVIMALRHNRFPTCGVQFHPESVLTPSGARMIRNWAKHDQRSLC
jgi:anthranilate synthase component 2